MVPYLIPPSAGWQMRTRPRVLIVDDNRDELHMLRTALSGRFDLLEAGDGLDAYALACTERPSAIVLDIAMPIVDGWTVLRKLRANPSTKDIPVVIFTALDVNAFRPEARALNVQAMIRKPIPTQVLDAVIRRAVVA
jgi:CheY-like chemotaxis protein